MKTIKRKITAPYMISYIENFRKYFFAIRTCKNIEQTKEYKQAIKMLESDCNDITSIIVSPLHMIEKESKVTFFTPAQLDQLKEELTRYELTKNIL